MHPHAHAWPDPALVRRLREAAARLFETAYQEAGEQGLCGDGAVEYALDRLRTAEPAELLDHADPP